MICYTVKSFNLEYPLSISCKLKISENSCQDAMAALLGIAASIKWDYIH
jgi:hypothetical protein